MRIKEQEGGIAVIETNRPQTAPPERPHWTAEPLGSRGRGVPGMWGAPRPGGVSLPSLATLARGARPPPARGTPSPHHSAAAAAGAVTAGAAARALRALRVPVGGSPGRRARPPRLPHARLTPERGEGPRTERAGAPDRVPGHRGCPDEARAFPRPGAASRALPAEAQPAAAVAPRPPSAEELGQPCRGPPQPWACSHAHTHTGHPPPQETGRSSSPRPGRDTE